MSDEDIGLRRTAFDNYDALEHFNRIKDFTRIFLSFELLEIEQVSDISHSLEEIHPKLFDVLASASRTLERAETVEDYAQVSLSGRRFLEQVANYLYPPREVRSGERLLSKTHYINRLWAYIENATSETEGGDSTRLSCLGDEADRLYSLFCGGLHSDNYAGKSRGGIR